MLFLFALLAGWLTGSPCWAGAIEKVRVHGNRVVITFDTPVRDATAFLLPQPHRIALDIAGAQPGAAMEASGTVAAIRQGAREDGARIVLDLARPAIIIQGGFSGGGRTLTLQLRTVDDARFARTAAEQPLRFLSPFGDVAAHAPARSYSVAVAIPPRGAAAPLPRVYGDDAGRPLVVIDPGHGGHDPGAIGAYDLREKDLTLKTALAVRDALLASGRVRVALTREDDRFIALQDRYGLARRLHADLFISIHCDSAGNSEASGATIYTLSEVASDKEAARLAARENKADILAGLDLGGQDANISSILIDLTQRETMNASSRFAQLLGREAQPLVPIKAKYHRMASLMVLKAPDMPSVLFETGYISNPSDALFLASDEGRHKIAETIRKAVEIHFATRMAQR